MRVLLGLLLGCAASLSAAQEQEIQRSVIQRDQQSAEFAARVRGADVSRLEQLHARQLMDLAVREVVVRPPPPELPPYQAQKMLRPAEKPLPLPGGPKHGVDPIPVQSARD